MNSRKPLSFLINRHAVRSYFYWGTILFLLLVLGWLFGLGVILAFVYACVIGPKLSTRQANALNYRLDGTTLRVDEGVFWLKRKAIPLDRVTDIVLSQGVLLRRFGIWALEVQTAGSGEMRAEGRLIGLQEPERVRDLLLAARDQAVAGDPIVSSA